MSIRNIGDIFKGQFILGHFMLETFCQGHFVLGTFITRDILSWDIFAVTFCPGHFVTRHFVLELIKSMIANSFN